MIYIYSFISAFSCAAALPTIITTVSGATSLGYTQYTYNYTATKTVPMLAFAVSAGNNVLTYVDDIAVVDTVTSTQLLTNPSFESSSTYPAGWVIWCSSSCGGGVTVGSITTGGGICNTGNCYTSQCTLSNNDYLVQAFPAIISRVYTISFWYQRIKTGGGANTGSTVTVGII